MRRRITIAAAIAALAASAAPAHATDYCVTPASGCSPGNTFSDIQPALTAAQALGDDRVLIGSRTYDLPSGGLSYNGDRVDVIGAGAIPPVLRQPTTSSSTAALAFSHAGSGRSTIRGLDFVVGQNTTGVGGPNSALGAGGAVDVSGIGVRAASDATRAAGVTLNGSATLSRADILLGYLADGATGVQDAFSTSDTTAVRDCAIQANTGVFVTGGATLTIERSQLTVSTQGVWAFDGNANAYDNVVKLEPQTAVTNAAFYSTAGSRDTNIDVRYATVTGGDANSVGLFVQSSSTNSATGALLDSIVRNPGTTLYRAGPAATPGANLAANYNDFNPSAVEGNNAATPGSYINLNGRTDDPGFVGGAAPLGLRLRHDSPLIDAGHPVPLSTPSDDFDGNSHVVDGNGDGTARADLGAYEYQRQPPAVTAAAAPDSAFPGDPITWTASGSDPDGDPLTYAWSWDDGGSADGASVTHAFAPLGTHTGTVTARDPTGLTATATASATVNARPVPPGGGGGGGGGGAAADRIAPRFSIARGALKLTAKNVITVRLSCDRAETETCKGTLTLASTRKLVRRKKVLTLGRKTFRIAPGKSARVNVKVSKSKARTARRLRRFQVAAKAVARDAAGNSATKRTTATLTAGKAKKR